ALPPPDDPAIAKLLEGLRQAAGAAGCSLRLELPGHGPPMAYALGEPCASGQTLRIHLEVREGFRAAFQLCGAGRGPAASPAALEALAPVLQGALDALVERYNSNRQVEVLAQILNAADKATLLVDLTGEILFANPRGDEFLALHTEEPLARLNPDAPLEPLLHLVVREMQALSLRPENMVRRTLTLVSGQAWQLELVLLSRASTEGHCLVILSPIHLPTGRQLHLRLKEFGVSPREAEVIAHLLRGRRNPEVAAAMGITEYTVKDHLKHLFAKLSVSSRTELFARLAAEGAIPPQT
ncbi:MAG: hypothetical protein HRF46_16165, partial [Acidobacteriota bacterium]